MASSFQCTHLYISSIRFIKGCLLQCGNQVNIFVHTAKYKCREPFFEIGNETRLKNISIHDFILKREFLCSRVSLDSSKQKGVDIMQMKSQSDFSLSWNCVAFIQIMQQVVVFISVSHLTNSPRHKTYEQEYVTGEEETGATSSASK